MRIRKLELHGFKSFPDRTDFVFGRGISGIVGPNGCGKSNVVDAVKWVIGETSAKALRGSEMTDILFAGSATRSPVGFSEVSLTFTADDGEPFPGELAHLTEVSITRRLEKSGNSEYRLNQTRCRKRDITDFLLDTGVSNDLYAFIEQGRIDKMIRAKPEERRLLIDEAAGISRYKVRREEALGRLESTAVQLDRAADVEEEMLRRLTVLERQVLTAARFKQLRARVRQAEVALAVVKVSALVQDRRALSGELRTAKRQVTELEQEWERQEHGLATRRDELSSVEAALEQWRDELAEREARRRELEGAAGFARRRIEEGEGAGSRAREQLSGARSSQASAEEALAAAEQAVEQAREAEAQASEQAAAARETARTRAEEQGAVRARVDAAKEQVARATEAVLGVKAKLSSLRERTGRIPEQEQQLATRLQALEQARAAAAAAATAARARQATLTEELSVAQTALEKATANATTAEAAWRAQQEAAQARRAAADAAEKGVAAQLAAARRGVARLEELHRAELQTLIDEHQILREEDRARVAAERRTLEATSRRALGEARQRAQTWRRLREEQDGTALASVRMEHDAALEELGEQLAEEAKVLAGRAAAALTSALSAAEATHSVRPALRALERTEHAASEAEAVLQQARDAHDQARSRVSALRASEAAASAAWEEHRRQGRALAAALPDVPSLQERLDVPPEREAWLAAVAGEGLSRVVATAEQVVALAGALEPGEQAVLWLGHPSERAAIDGDEAGRAALGGRLATHTVVADLDAAIAHFLAGSGGAVVVPGGARVDPDGTVWLGSADAAGAGLRAQRRAEETARELAVATEALQLREAQLEEARQRHTLAASAVEEAREALEAARETLEGVRQQVRRHHQEEARLAQREQEQRARHERQQLQEAQTSELEELRQRQLTRQQEEDAAAEQGLAALAAARQEQEQEQEQRWQEHAARLASAQQEAVAALRAEHAEIGMLASARSRTVEQAVERHRDDLRASVLAARSLVEDADLHRQRARDLRQSAIARCQELRLAIRQAASDEESALQESGRREQDVQQVLAAQGQLGEELAQLARAEADLGVELQKVLAVEGERRTALKVLQEALAQAEQQASTAAEARTAAEVALAGRAEQVRTVAAQVQTHRTRIEAARSEGERAATQAAEADEKVATARQELARSDAQLQEVAKDRTQVQERLDRDRARQQKLKDALTAARASQHEVQERLAAVRVEAERVQARLESLREELSRTRTAVADRYQVEVDGLLDLMEARREVHLEPDESVRTPLEVGSKRVEAVEPLLLLPSHLVDEDWVEDTVARLETDRAALERLGEVNLTAVEEYRELAARHADIAAQREDLEESMSRIRAAIAKINRTCRERFRDAFDAVDGHFRVLYPRLVGGGQASLGLTDEDDLLETGVDIFVQPPGKRLQNLTLLSGGEKAMTAIALMLSLFKVKPSPFCMLDEVDAPLDEGNGSRFNELLVEMSAASQFIVVTHNKKTMEVADTLYGVTMATPGVSRLVTVSLD